MDMVEIRGDTLKEILEYSVKDYDPADKHGKFLQVSGTFILAVVNKNAPFQ